MADGLPRNVTDADARDEAYRLDTSGRYTCFTSHHVINSSQIVSI